MHTPPQISLIKDTRAKGGRGKGAKANSYAKLRWNAENKTASSARDSLNIGPDTLGRDAAP